MQVYVLAACACPIAVEQQAGVALGAVTIERVPVLPQSRVVARLTGEADRGVVAAVLALEVVTELSVKDVALSFAAMFAAWRGRFHSFCVRPLRGKWLRSIGWLWRSRYGSDTFT